MHIIFFSCLLLIRGVVHAHPVTTPLSVDIAARVPPPKIKLEIEQVELNRDGDPYTIIPLTEGVQGGRSRSFRIKGGFQDGKKVVPAILKRVFDKEWKDNPNSNTVKEIGFLDRPSIGLHLFSKWSNRTTNDPPYQIDIVVRDITAENPPFKSFLDWYVEDNGIKAIDGLRNIAQNIKKRLMWYAMNEDLIYYDFAMANIFIRKQVMETPGGPTGRSINSSITVMPVDWGLEDTYSAGVVDISALNQEEKQEEIQAFEEELDDQLENSYNTEMLAKQLKTRNQELRSDDIKKVAFKGRTYELLHFKTLDDYTGMYAVVGDIKLEKNGKMSDVPGFMYVVDLEKDDGKDRIWRANRSGLFVDSEEAGNELLILCRNQPDASD